MRITGAAADRQDPAPTPLVGGIAIMVPLALWCLTMLIAMPEQATRLHLTVLLCGVGVAVMGLATLGLWLGTRGLRARATNG